MQTHICNPCSGMDWQLSALLGAPPTWVPPLRGACTPGQPPERRRTGTPACEHISQTIICYLRSGMDRQLSALLGTPPPGSPAALSVCPCMIAMTEAQGHSRLLEYSTHYNLRLGMDRKLNALLGTHSTWVPPLR